MSNMIFSIQAIEKQDNRVDVSIQVGEDNSSFFIECDDPALLPSREAVVAMSLFPAMKNGIELKVGGEVSAQLMESLSTLQDVYHGWFPDAFTHIAITEATPVMKKSSGAERVGAFFSGGVDSWYTFLKHRDEITDLILVWGFDMPLDKPDLFELTRKNIQRVADEFGKNLVVLKTNLRDFTDRYVPWKWLFGTGLCAMGHLLAGGFKKFYIASALHYGFLVPDGSHILVDPLWSMESLELVHDGLEVTRLDKIRTLAQHEVALQTLRVCWRNPGGVYNCGWCEKCLRTMVALQIVGAYERCTTFRGPINAGRLGKLRSLDEFFVHYSEENLLGLKQQPCNEDLYHAQRKMILRYYFRTFISRVLELYPEIKIGRGRFVKKLGKM